MLTQPFTFDYPRYIARIVVVGLGGTGAQVARIAARILYDRERHHQSNPEMLFVDPDTIEASNVGRQMFLESQIGTFKAQALAIRFNLALGLQIAWSNQPLDNRTHIRSGDVIIDCTDNHLARREIMANEGHLIISSGNHTASGQVVIGCTGDKEAVITALNEASKRNQSIACLPHAGLLFSSLLEPESQPQPDLSCAELTSVGSQHLLINDMQATIVGQYLYKLLHREPITTFASFISLHPTIAVQSPLICKDELLPYLS